jgi:uncharacterized membrane protein YbhN (UPF0104 family)
LLLLSLVPLLAGVLLLALPVRNPGLQDCGAPAVFAISGRTNALAPRVGENGRTAEDVAALRAQTPCNERVDDRLRLGLWSIGSFLVLAFVGAVLGVVDDRWQLRRAPRFEALLRERPAGAPGEVWDQPIVPSDDMGVTLPDLENSDVEAVVVWSVVTVCVLLIVSGIGDAFDVLSDIDIVGLFVAVLLVAVLRLVAGAELSALERGLLGRARGFGHATQIAIGCDWAGRMRPAFGAIGAQAHAMIRDGVARSRALLGMGSATVLSFVVHTGLTVVFLSAAVLIGEGDGSWPRYSIVLMMIILAMIVAGGVVLTARIRQLPCTLGRPALRHLASRFSVAPAEVITTVALSAALPMVHGLVLWTLVIAVGGDIAFVLLIATMLSALAFRAYAPTPDGYVASDVVLVIGLALSGVEADVAVVAVLLWRVLTSWIPLAPGYIMTRRLSARGTF